MSTQSVTADRVSLWRWCFRVTFETRRRPGNPCIGRQTTYNLVILVGIAVNGIVGERSVMAPQIQGDIVVEVRGGVLVARLDSGPHNLFGVQIAEQLDDDAGHFRFDHGAPFERVVGDQIELLTPRLNPEGAAQ